MKIFATTAVLLGSLNSFGADSPKVGVNTLIEVLNRSGAPAIADTTVSIDGKTIKDMKFGRIKQGLNFDGVDEVKKKVGGTATLFLKEGDEFVRITTNVLKGDGTRAVGTTLAHNKAYDAILRGEEFCGDVEILDSPYSTCYHPVKADGKVIGIYYFGYKK